MVIFADMKISAIIRKGLLLLCFAPCLASAQNTVSGIVSDSRSNEPMPYATVYVNGTTKGTITNDDGLFELQNVKFPATLVFSFVGYKAQVLELDRNPSTLQIKLDTNDALPEVTVTDYNDRERYIQYFKTMFLGDDLWGQSATILNEDAIMFENTGNVFRAWAGEPIIIDLPLLGYELYADLANFSVYRADGKAICDILGYYYYKPYNAESARKNSKYGKNRAKAYYNSNLHFLRSLYQDRLAENGYILSDSIGTRSGKTAGGEMQISGLSDKRIAILYYHKLDGSPLDLTKHKPGIHMYSESAIHLVKDTCTILSNGTITDNSIRFSGDISEKRIGASLPADY